MIEFLDDSNYLPHFNVFRFQEWIESVVREEGKCLGELCFIFGSDDWLLEYNRTYLQHDYYTDIITFDYSSEDDVSGDLLISVERVDDNAKDNNVPRETELLRVCVHGVLHLCGYGDKSSDEVLVMRQKEDAYLCTY